MQKLLQYALNPLKYTPMKKLLLFLIAIAFAASGNAMVVDIATGKSVIGSAAKSPDRSIEYVDDGIIVTYKFSHINLHPDELYPGTYSAEIPSFSTSFITGYPAVPCGVGVHIMPSGSEPTLTVLNSTYTDLSYELAPARLPKSMSDTVPYSLDNVPPIEAYSGYWPKEVCEPQPTGMYRHQPLAKVAINPVRYNYDNKTIRVYKEIKYKITFSNNASMADVYYEPLSLLNPNCTLAPNPNGVMPCSSDTPGSSVAANSTFMIISVPQFKETLQEYVKWKKRLGHNVVEYYDSDLSFEKILTKVKQTYDDDLAFKYLLLVGDHQKVPSRTFTEFPGVKIEYGKFITDFYYSCLDSTLDADIDPDIFVGRWPVENISDLETIIDKTIWYEQAPPIDEEFYKTASHFSFFEDGKDIYNPHDGVEDSRFVKTSEDVRNYLINNHDFNISRIYSHYTHKDSTFRYWPRQWSRYYAGEDCMSFPSELLYENGFKWEGKYSDLVSDVNDGVSYILFIGHGMPSSWTKTSGVMFYPANVFEMNNYDRLPVVFSIACHTGMHDNDGCLMRFFLRKKDGGAVATFANTNVAFMDNVGRTTSLLFNAIWSDPGLKMTGINCDISNIPELAWINNTEHKHQFGAILKYQQYGMPAYKFEDVGGGGLKLAFTSIYNRQVLHCFADPSTYYHTSCPKEITGVEVSRTGQCVHVFNPNGKAYIAFYDPIKNVSTRYYGDEAAYCTGVDYGSEYVDVTVYTPDDRPYIDYGKPYYGVINGNKEYGILGYRDLRNGSVEIDFRLSSYAVNKSVEMHIVDPTNGSIVSSWPITNRVADVVSTVSMRADKGVMMAYLMIGGSPTYSMKIYVSKN